MAALSFLLLLMLVVIMIILYLFYYICNIILKRKPSNNLGTDLFKKMIIESHIKKIVIGRRKYIRLKKTYNNKIRIVILPERMYVHKNLFNIYDSFLIFNNLFQMENNNKNVFRWIKVVSYFYLLSWIIFFTVMILTILNSINSLGLDLNDFVEYFSFVGVFIFIFSWFFWVSSIERMRDKVIKIAEEFLSENEVRKMKFLSALKAIVPLSNNFL